jgi:hypothetical protein
MCRARRLVALAIGLGLASVAVPAGAAPVPFTASLTIRFGSLGEVVASGSGTGTSTGAGGIASIPAGVFSIALTTPINPPLLVIEAFGVGAPGVGLSTSTLPLPAGTNQALSFGGVTGTMGLDSSAYLITASGVVVPGIPLAIVGVGGTKKVSYLGGLVMFTVAANPYQLGMVTVMGGLQGAVSTLMATGFDNRVGPGLTGLQLVSPTMVSAGALGSIPVISIITFVPEPTTFALVVVGLAALAGLRRRHASS